MCFLLIIINRFTPTQPINVTQNPFNKNEYDESLFTRLLPICEQSMLQTEAINIHSSTNDVMMGCSEFLPTLTTRGICLTRNAENLDQILKTNSHLSTFQDTFYPPRHQHNVENITTDLSTHHFSFVIDSNTYKDLKRGKDWNISSNTVFNIGIHSPTDVADIRGWYNQIMVVPTGYITKITIKQSEIKADDTLRSVGMEARKCRFTEENNDLPSVMYYSKVNCLLDCNMEVAQKTCGCRPWDYPTPDDHNDTSTKSQFRICDYFGTSCFTTVLQGNSESKCLEKCVPNCDEINYSISIDKEPIDPGRRICSYNRDPINALELEIKKHVLTQFVENHTYVDVTGIIASEPPERRMMSLLKEILSNSNDSYYLDEKKAYEQDCVAKLNSDVAAVIVSIDSPTFTRMVKSSKVSFFDKLAILGKIP